MSRHRLTADQKRALYSAMDVGASFLQAIGYARSRECVESYAARRAEKDRQEKSVSAWNAAYAIGARVVVTRWIDGPTFETKTRSEAFLGSSGHASIFVEGETGSWGLDFVRPVEMPL